MASTGALPPQTLPRRLRITFRHDDAPPPGAGHLRKSGETSECAEVCGPMHAGRLTNTMTVLKAAEPPQPNCTLPKIE